MSIYVTEPGRPVHNRLPESLRARRVRDLDETAASPAAAARSRVPEELAREQQRRLLHARQAIEEYKEGVTDEPESERPYLPVDRLLTRSVHRVPASTSLLDALRSMEELAIHHLVVDANSVVAGLIDIRWLLKVLCEDYAQRSARLLSTMELPAFLTATPETDAHELARQMLAHRLDAALVLDGQNQPQGVITSSDYLRLYAEVTPHEHRI